MATGARGCSRTPPRTADGPAVLWHRRPVPTRKRLALSKVVLVISRSHHPRRHAAARHTGSRLHFSGTSATMNSVVRMFLAIEAAFCRAERVTMEGSMMPALTMSSYSPVAMFRPMPLAGLDLVHHDGAFQAGVVGQLTEGLFEGAGDDLLTRAVVDVVGLLSTLTAATALTSTTPPPGTMPSSRAARVAFEGVFDSVLLLLHLDLGRRADLDDGDAAGQLRQALLQLLAVEVGVGVLDLALDLLDAGLDLVGVAGAVDDGRVVLGRRRPCARGRAA